MSCEPADFYLLSWLLVTNRPSKLPDNADVHAMCQRHTPIPHSIVESSDVYVMPFILRQFSIPRQTVNRTFGPLECIHNLVGRADNSSALYQACHAVSHAYLANKSRSSTLVLSHRNSYGKSLRALKVAISDPELQRDDTTLLAVWILCLYELVLGTAHREGPMNWDTHSRALLSLLRVRGRQQFESVIGCQLFQLVYPSLQIQTLQAGNPPPSDGFDWFGDIHASVKTARLAFVPAYPYIDEVIRLCNHAKQLIRKQRNTSENMSADAIKFVHSCHKFEKSMTGEFEGTMTDSLLDITTEIRWEQHRKLLLVLHNQNYIDACFLCLHYSILELLRDVVQQPEILTTEREEAICLRESSVQHARSRAERILMSIPNFLPKAAAKPTQEAAPQLVNWADALKLMWPIRVVASSPVVCKEQKLEARCTLMKVAYEVGIMQAVGTYFDTFTAHQNM